MTNPLMTLNRLIEKTGDADILREIWVCQSAADGGGGADSRASRYLI
jgi:hypothetical protein